jgi:membrane-associated phospholipid phosphatase
MNVVNAQFTDTARNDKSGFRISTSTKTLAPKSLILPGALITYGFATLASNGLKNVNQQIKNEVWAEKTHKQQHLDTYLQFGPAVSVYALNAFGIKGKNNFRDRSMIYILSNVIVNGIVYPTKKLAGQERPDSSNTNSFPSGHTAEAFASAEFMRMEYKNVSAWYGVAGYAMAITTGYLRMYNNKHWFSDVVAGAGIGILSTKLAYWLYPKIQHKLFKDKLLKTVMLPYYQNNSFGIGLVHRF